ncbi:MAG: ABC transporter substrate-binding protein, partial [Dehalococcoidia bacterium]
MAGVDQYWRNHIRRTSRRRILAAGTAATAVTAAFLAACGGEKDAASSSTSSGAGSAPAGESASNAIEDGLAEDHPLIAKYHWSTVSISKSPPKTGGRFRYPMSDPAMWDPTDPSATAASNAWGWMYSRLLKPNGRLEDALAGRNNFFENVSDGDLAASWEQPDPTTYIFKLRDNVRFHDIPPVNGRTMTAEDIKYSFDTYQKPASTAHVSIFRDVKSVEAPDPTTIKITTNRPVAYLLHSLTSPLTVVFAREAYERPQGLKPAPPIGTGPFVVKDYKSQSSITMDKNPNYFIPGRPYLDGADGVLLADRASYIAAFRTGQLDYLALLGEDEFRQLEQTEKGKMDVHVNQQNNGGVQWHFGMNLELPLWRDVRVRRGMSMALDRASAASAVWLAGHNSLGFPTDWLSRRYLPRDDEFGEWYTYNPGEAKKLLEAAGATGSTIKLQAPGTTVPANDLASLAIQEWKAVGLTVEYEPMEAVAFNS